MTLHDDLDALLAGDEPDWDNEPEAPADAEHADRMLRRLRLLKAELADANTLADTERDRIELWLATETMRIGARVAHLTAALEVFHRSVLAEDSKRKTLSLPNGRLVARAQPPEWTFDPEQFVPWAETECPELLRRRPAPPAEVDKTKAKGHLSVGTTEDGRVVWDGDQHVPGVTVNQRPTKFTIETEN